MCFKAVIFFFLFSAICGSFNEFIRSAFMGHLFNFQCPGLDDFPYLLLYTRNHPDRPRLLLPDDRTLLDLSDYNPTQPTKVIIHGFLDSIHMNDWMQRMKDRMLSVDDCNVILVDWSCGNLFPYARAVQNSRTVAEKLAGLIRFLEHTVGANSSSFHLIGHSMGSHIAARVGQVIPNLGRITALDPALPRFHRMSVEDRLDPSDASFVDVIHSDAGYSIFEGFGIRTKVGHVDFYPNGGNNQPGCKQSPLSIVPRLGVLNGFRYYVSCDHYRAVEFFIESIQASVFSNSTDESHCQPVAVACNSWETFTDGKCADCSFDACAFMGYNSDLYHDLEGSRKEYFLKTNQEEPFCSYQYQVRIETELEQNVSGEAFARNEARPDSGIFRLELETARGRKTRLDDNAVKEINSAEDYIYLATSRVHIDGIQSARFWFDSTTRSDMPVSQRTPPPATKLKRIKITPIEISPLLYSSSPRQIVLCGSNDKKIERNRQIILSEINC